MTKYKINATYSFDIELEVEAENAEQASITASLQPLGEWYVNAQQLDIDSVEEVL